jgi:hypothetical protein
LFLLEKKIVEFSRRFSSFRIPRKSNRIKLDTTDMAATVTVVTQQVVDGLKQRMADLNVRGTMAPGHLVFSVIDFLQHARTDTPTYGDATHLFRCLEDRWGEDFTRHVFMIKLPRGNSTYRTPTMTLGGLHTLLPLLGSKVQPEFRRIFEGIITGIVRGES